MNGSGRLVSGHRMRKASTLSFTPLMVVALAAAVVLLGAAPSYAAKPAPKLTSTLCAALGGTWAIDTCTIAKPATATSSFLVPDGTSLVVDATEKDPNTGCVLSIASGVTLTVAASGTITVANTLQYAKGVCNFGTIANLGAIDIQNSGDASNGLANGGAITNAGTITIANSSSNSVGIGNFGLPGEGVTNGTGYILATLANTGTIAIANTGDNSTGLFNYGAVTNSGTLAILKSLGGTAKGVMQSDGTFTNEASGTLTNDGGTYDASTDSGYPGFFNASGTMINFGTANNTGAMVTWGWVMLTYGTINNYGLVYQGSGELVNYGTVHNFGVIGASYGAPDYPHNRGICINETLNGVTGSGC